MKNEVIYLYSIFIIIVAFFLLNSLPPMDYILIGLLIVIVNVVLGVIESEKDVDDISTLSAILSLVIFMPINVILKAYIVYIAMQFMTQYVSSNIALIVCILTLTKVKEAE